MSTPTVIRRARASDAAVISSLIEQHVASGTLLPRTPEFIAERAIDFLVATVDGRVVGCVHLEEYSPSLAEVRSIVVDAAHQRRGVGAALVNAVEALARTREYRTLFAVSNNDAFFRSRGYLPREIPELSRERSEVTRFKGVYAKNVGSDGGAEGSKQ
jgi:N-acetylglutamate synthase-like GNAT family acetyltransferase